MNWVPYPVFPPATMNWITVFRGPMWEVIALQAKLEAHDIPVFLPDAGIKSIDPFITGADAFGVSLQVPEPAVSEARSLLQPERVSGHDPVPLPADEHPPSSIERELDKRGTRLRWSAVFGLVFPPAAFLALYTGYDYWRLVRSTELRPRAHRVNILAACLSIALILGYTLLFLELRLFT